MAEKEVLFEDNMETQAQDFNNLQDWIGNSIDDVVVDAIDAGNAYTGLGISKAAATQVTIAPGRLYWGGAVYIMEDPVVIDFQTVPGGMPVTQQRQIAIVAWNSTITTDVQPRNFVVDADTGQAQPESVAMTSIRTCNVGPIPGVEAPSPNFPAVPATNLLIGYVLLNPSGVVSIQQTISTQLANLASVEAQVGALANIVAQEQTQIATLQTALAALAAQLANYVTWDAFNKLSDLVNWCVLAIQKLQMAGAYALNTIDNFFDTSQSAVGTNVDGAYNALVASGLRFGTGATWTGKLVLGNPTEPLIQAWDTFILPAPSGMRVRMDCSFPTLDYLTDTLTSHPYWTFTSRRLNWSRYRYRCGPPYLPTPQSQVLASLANCDPVASFLKFDIESWTPIINSVSVQYPDFDPDFPRWSSDRYKYYWEDWVDVDYWSKVYTNFPYTHNLVAQSFLNSQDGWLGGITLFSMQAGFYQPLTIHITECDDQGVPDHTATLGKIDLDAPTIQSCYGTPLYAGDVTAIWNTSGSVEAGFTPTQIQGLNPTQIIQVTPIGPQLWYIVYNIPQYVYPLRVNFSPVFLKAGKRYAFHVHSTYAHQFACSIDRSCYQVHGGNFWEYDTVSWFRVWTGGPRTLRFMLHYLTWGNWGDQQNPGGQLRYDIEMQPLSLSPGISNVDILAEHIVPPATNLNYAVYVNGEWMGFDSDPDSPSFSGTQNLMRLKATFTGTSDLMPGVSLTNSQVKLTSPMVSPYHHISTPIPITSTTTGVKVQTAVYNYNSAHHSLLCHIHTAGGQLTPSPVSSVANPDGSFQMTWTFGQTGITSYQVELDGTTDGTGDNFVVSQRASFSA